MPSITEKTCSKKTCLSYGKLQSVENFFKDSSKKDGYKSSCKLCVQRPSISKSARSVGDIRTYHHTMSSCSQRKIFNESSRYVAGYT